MLFRQEKTAYAKKSISSIKDYHRNSYIPRKKPKNGQVSLLAKNYNRTLAQKRIVIEHVNRSLKIF